MNTHTATTTLVTHRDWAQVMKDYESSAPFHYAVLDSFLEADACERLRESLLNHWGWRHKNWSSEQLYNHAPDIPEIKMIAEILKGCLPELLGNLDLIKYWAVMHYQNVGLHPHADGAKLQFNIWLTPDEYNLEPDTGGLIVFDTKRTPDMMIHEFATAPYCVQYHEQHTKGNQAKISYRYNRAMIFDGLSFHASDKVRFANSGTQSHRINLSLSFDDPDTHAERKQKYNV